MIQFINILKKNKHLYAYSFFLIAGISFGSRLKAQELFTLEAFNFPEAKIAELGAPLSLWATNYNLPEIEDGQGDFPLRDVDGNELGPKLTLEDWCRSALEGSVRIILKTGEIKTFNYDNTSPDYPIDCSGFFTLNLGTTKFKKARGSFGDGAGKYKLTPYRTIATDPLVIPTGSVLYIPDARGANIINKDGQLIVHDGYFFAGDIGGAIKLNHIDVFIGTLIDSSFFPWISHASTLPFQAYIVKDQDIINNLILIHSRSK